jgi:integrase
VLVAELRKLLKQIPDSLPGKRDHALLLLGFAGAFRRSELVGLDVKEVQRDGMVLIIGRSKTDQAGGGKKARHSVRR